MDNFEDLVNALARNECNLSSLLSEADHLGCSGIELCNRVASHVARHYQSGTASFDECNGAMNALFNIACVPTSPMFDPIGSAMWFAVYRAFDEGEYRHPGDESDTVAELKYTQPLVAAILASND